MKNISSFILLMAALITFAGCPSEGGGTVVVLPPITSGNSIISFDAASGSLKQIDPVTLSKAENGQKMLKAADGFDSYLWIIDDYETLGIEQELTLKAASLEKGTHKLVLIITTEDETPYSSPAITVTVTD